MKELLAPWIVLPGQKSQAAAKSKAKPKKNVSSDLPKFPKILRRRLVDAINVTEKAVQIAYGNTDWKSKLDRWRELNKTKTEDVSDELIAAMLPLQKLIGADDVQILRLVPYVLGMREGMTSDLWSALEHLDKVFSEVHQFDPHEAICKGMPELINRRWKKGNLLDETKEAKDYLRHVNYLDAPRGASDTHGTKGFHTAMVVPKLVSTGTFQKITKELREERLNSQNRTEK